MVAVLKRHKSHDLSRIKSYILGYRCFPKKYGWIDFRMGGSSELHSNTAAIPQRKA